MKIFENGQWSSKINFVDKNNVLVGFDYSQSCCESFGYIISEQIPCLKGEYDHYSFEQCVSETELEDYCFIPDFYDDSEGVSFKITNGTKELFLTLYNHHNGYYSHGFFMEVGGVKIHDGSL